MVFDIAALVFIVVFSFFMMKKGGVRAILSLTSLILSIIIASFVYPVLTEAVYKTPLPENVEEIVSEVLVEKGEAASWEAALAMPDFVRNALGIEAEETIAEIAEDITAKITKVVISVIIFLLVVVVTKFLLAFLIGALDIVTKLPVIHQINSMLGLGAGIVMSLVIVWALVAAAGVLAASNVTVAAWIEGSQVVSAMSNISPF